jgi:hypothetical protein
LADWIANEYRNDPEFFQKARDATKKVEKTA